MTRGDQLVAIAHAGFHGALIGSTACCALALVLGDSFIGGITGANAFVSWILWRASR